MNRLPNWVLTETFPAVYDSESNTAIEMVAKLYGAMQKQIDEFNQLVNQVNKSISDFEKSTTKDIECFKTCITNVMENYIKSIDLKTDEAVEYMKTNIAETTTTVVKQLLDTGYIVITPLYNAETESLDITLSNNKGGTE